MALRLLGLMVTFVVWGMVPAQGQEVPIEEETQLPVQSSLLPEREELLKQHAVGMIERLAAGGADEVIEDFEEVMRRALPAAKLTSTWQSVIASYGKVRSVTWQRTETRDDLVAIILAIRFEKGRLDSRIVYTPENHVTGWFFVAPGPWQDASYVDPTRFEEIELQFGPTWFPIRGTLSLPLGEGPFPAAILLHGSGPQDRDETIGGNKPFRDLAQGLASRGIAVLRFDKRTYSHGLALSVLLPRLTVKEEILNDAVTAFQTLIQQPRIDVRRIAMVGHSLGGTVLPRVHKMEPRVAGLAFLAAASRPLEDLTWEQVNYLLAADGQIDEAERETLELLKKAVALVKSEQLNEDTPASQLPLGVPASYWLDLRQHDPVQEALQISVPMVFIQGERDYQVTEADFSLWRQALETRSDVTFRSFPQLNHLLIPGEGPAGPAEYFEPGHVGEEVITELANFLQNLPPRELEPEKQ